MRFTCKLCAQHLGWTFKKHWQIQGKRVPHDTGAIIELQNRGIQVKDANEVLTHKLERKSIEIVGVKPAVITEDQTHPNWHNQVCHSYGNSNILLEGLLQAQVLTNTIIIDKFPHNIEESISNMQVTTSTDRSVKNAIIASHVYDAQQVKLPKVKLSERPSYNLPRDYGINHDRRNRLLVNKLIYECEKLIAPAEISRRKLLDDVDFKITLSKDEDILQFDISAEKILMSTNPIEPVRTKFSGEFPDLYPIKCTITMPKKHIYTTNNIYSLRNSTVYAHPHTIFLNFNKEMVGNLHETNVSTTQFQSRTMLKSFAVAASKAKQLYGDNFMGPLPKPIVVQGIQTDGRSFHFGVFQLNTLSLNTTEGTKNYWFQQSNLDLFSDCGYKAGRPTLVGYNKDVFRVLNAFYKS